MSLAAPEIQNCNPVIIVVLVLAIVVVVVVANKPRGGLASSMHPSEISSRDTLQAAELIINLVGGRSDTVIRIAAMYLSGMPRAQS